VKGEFEANGQSFSNACFDVKGKGMVKQETQINGQTITIELKRFKKGTGKVVNEDEDEPEEKQPEGKDKDF